MPRLQTQFQNACMPCTYCPKAVSSWVGEAPATMLQHTNPVLQCGKQKRHNVRWGGTCASGSRPTGAAVHMGHVTARSCRQSRPGAFPLLSSRNRCSGTASGTEAAPEQACGTAVPCSGTCVPSAGLLRSTRACCPWALLRSTTGLAAEPVLRSTANKGQYVNNKEEGKVIRSLSF